MLINIFGFAFIFIYRPDNSLLDTASQLNSFSPGTLIETYDAELFIYLNQPYHYPPDDVQLKLVERQFLDSETTLDYNPLDYDPEIIVIGPMGKLYGLYDDTVSLEEFKLFKEYGRYAIYIRTSTNSISSLPYTP